MCRERDIKEESKSMLPESYAMNGGDGPYSYAQNSFYQRGALEAAKQIIKEEVEAKLDINQISLSASDAFRIADFGCSTGPNTILAVQAILEAVMSKFPYSEFHVFFNDQVTNDFNTLFASLPEKRRYYAAGVPGSFHGRLFPKASLHFVFSSCALSWLSSVPKEVSEKGSPAWNKGRIHYSCGASKEVYEAYSSQFRKDMEKFLDARAEEVVGGGLMALLIHGVPDVLTKFQTTSGSEFELLGSCLIDMANMGAIPEESVDSFNLPYYLISPKECEDVIKRNKYFSIERMETLENLKKHIAMPNPKLRTLYLRAVFEGLIQNHFGSQIMDELFQRYSRKVKESSFFLNPDDEKSILLFVLLKRNANE